MKLARSGWPIVSSSFRGNLQASSSPPNANTLPVLVPKVLLSTPHCRKYPVSYTPQLHHLPASLYPHNRVHPCSRFAIGLRSDGVLRHAHFPDLVPLRRANAILITSCIKALDSRARRLRVARSQQTTTSASPLLRLCFASIIVEQPTSPNFAHPPSKP